MASPPVNPTDPRAFLRENGYFYEEDAAVGRLVPELEKRGLAERLEGLDIAKSQLIQNDNARQILEPFLQPPDVLICITLGPDPGHRFVFSLEPGQKDHIIVHMCSPESTAELNVSSHLDPPGIAALKGAAASNGLIEVPNAALRRRGAHVPVEMRTGGIVLHDRRHAFAIKTGSTITYDLRKTDTRKEMPTE